MKHRQLLFLLMLGIGTSLSAQQMSLVAKGQSTQQSFLLSDYPRLTISTEGGKPSFNVHVNGHIVMGEAHTALFAESKDIVLQENKDAAYYDQFAKDFNGRTVNTATLNRQFTQGKWETLCLPFNVKPGLMMALRMYARVYEFCYAVTDGEGSLQIYFSMARYLEAGKGYLVNANAKLAQKTSFVFPSVTIDTSADNEDISALTGYNDGSGQGSSYMVGTLRTGLLQGTTGGNTYFGLKGNKIYYPNTSTGTNIRAYRSFFRTETPMDVNRVRIIVEGEEPMELQVVNGEIVGTDEAVKYIENGILYIERNGRKYNAQGSLISNL